MLGRAGLPRVSLKAAEEVEPPLSGLTCPWLQRGLKLLSGWLTDASPSLTLRNLLGEAFFLLLLLFSY